MLMKISPKVVNCQWADYVSPDSWAEHIANCANPFDISSDYSKCAQDQASANICSIKKVGDNILHYDINHDRKLGIQSIQQQLDRYKDSLMISNGN